MNISKVNGIFYPISQCVFFFLDLLVSKLFAMFLSRKLHTHTHKKRNFKSTDENFL